MLTTTDRFSDIRPGQGSLSILATMAANLKVQDSIMKLMDLYNEQGKSIYSGVMIDAEIKLNSYSESYHKMHKILISRGFDSDEIQHYLSIG